MDKQESKRKSLQVILECTEIKNWNLPRCKPLYHGKEP